MRAPIAFVVLALAACGRLGFDDATTTPAIDDATRDATGGGLCPAGCVSAGGACDGMQCVIGGTPNQPVACPAQQDCRIDCASGTCTTTITCPANTSCEVGCLGPNTCSGVTVTCDGDSCDLLCTDDTCSNMTFHCNAGRCRVHCCGSNVCNGNTVDGGGDFAFDSSCP